MDGGAWWAEVHGVAKSQTRLSDFTFTFGIMVFFGYMFRIGIAGSYGTSIFSFFKETLYCYGTVRNLHRGCTNTFPPIVYEGSLYSTTSAAFSSCRFFDDGHSDRCEVIPQCGFDLHFNN